MKRSITKLGLNVFPSFLAQRYAEVMRKFE